MGDEVGEMTEEEQFGEEQPTNESQKNYGEAAEEVETQEEKDELEDDLNITDSQVMIQLREAEEEAAALRKEIAALRREIDDYQCRSVLTEEDEEHLREIQLTLMEKIALLDELTKRIAKLMELAGRQAKSEDTTILSEEEEEGFPDDMLPKVVICSSWDDMMPKVVVCMDMKKPGAAGKKKCDEDRDENGLTPEQREALEKERRCMAEERNRLQYQIACMEGEMRVMMRENDMLSRKVAQLKADMENQPPFEFEMSVSATNPPGSGAPKPGNMDAGYGVMGPPNGGPYTFGATLCPGAEVQGRVNISPGPPQLPPGLYPQSPQGNCPQSQPGGDRLQGGDRQPGQLPCGGVTGISGKCGPCPKLQPQEPPPPPNPNDWSAMLPPYGKKCRKDFNASQAQNAGPGAGNCGNAGCGGGAGCGGCCGGGANGGYNGGYNGSCNGGGGCNGGGAMPPSGFGPSLLPPGMVKQPPMDVNFKVNVQPQTTSCDKRGSASADARSNKIAQQLQEIEMELRNMQRDLCKAKKDKDTLKAQQATLNCAKNYIM